MGRRRPRVAQVASRPWWQGVQRVYLDATVFETPESLECIVRQILPELQVRHAEVGTLRLVVHERSRHGLRQAATDPRGGRKQQASGAVLAALERIPYVEWLPAIEEQPQSVAAAIVTACLKHQPQCVQAVFTQDARLSRQVVDNARPGSSKAAHQVLARCVLEGRHMAWSEYVGEVPQGQGFGAALSPAELRVFRRFVIDTSSLMLTPHHQRSETDPRKLTLIGLFFLESLLPTIRATGARLVVRQEVMDELKRFAASELAPPRSNPLVPHVARRALDRLAAQDMRELIDIEPRMSSNGHADPALVARLAALGESQDMCFITQDRDLSIDLIRNLPGPPRYSRVCRIDDKGKRLLDHVRLQARQASRQARGDGSPSPQPPPHSSAPRPPVDASPAPPVQATMPAATAPGARVQPPAAAAPTPAPPAPEAASTPPATQSAGTPAAPQSVRTPTAPAAQSKDETNPHPTFTAKPARHAWDAAPPALRAAPPGPPAPQRRRWLAAAALVAVAGVGALGLMWPDRALSVSLLVDGRPVPLDGDTVRLPVGTRFVVTAVVPAAGSIELHAFNASQPQTPVVLMRVRAKAGETVTSPVLRVQAGPGEDRLELLHLPDGAPQTARAVRVRHR